MAEDDDGRPWVTVSEAARQLGCTRQAVQKRITRGTIQSTVNNRGERLVKAAAATTRLQPAPVPVTPREQPAPGLSEVRPVKPRQPRQEAPGLASLADVRALLGEQQAAHGAAMAALERQHRDMIAVVQERADDASVRAERAERLLLRMVAERERRPWWKRLW